MITAGAAQGSILGPDVGNVSCGGILRMKMPFDTYLKGYADDILAMIVARITEKLQWKLNQAMRQVISWMKDHWLKLAAEKSELLLIIKKHTPTEKPMQVGSATVTSKKTIKHLGIRYLKKQQKWASALPKRKPELSPWKSPNSGLIATIEEDGW